MPFAVRRADGAWLTRHRAWDEDGEKVRLFTGAGHASAALKRMAKENTTFEAEVVEIEWRVVNTRQRYEVSKGHYSSKAICQKILQPRHGFRHAD